MPETDRKTLTNVIEVEMKTENIRLKIQLADSTDSSDKREIFITFLPSADLSTFYGTPGGCHIHITHTHVRIRSHNDMKSISFAHSMNLSVQRLTRELM